MWFSMTLIIIGFIFWNWEFLGFKHKWGPKNVVPKNSKTLLFYNEREDYGGFRSWLIESATGKSFRYNSRNNNNFNDNSYNDRNYNNNSNYRRDNDFGTSRNFGRNDRNYDRNGRGRSYDDYRNNDYDKVGGGLKIFEFGWLRIDQLVTQIQPCLSQ